MSWERRLVARILGPPNHQDSGRCRVGPVGNFLGCNYRISSWALRESSPQRVRMTNIQSDPPGQVDREPDAFRWQRHPHIAKDAMCGAHGSPSPILAPHNPWSLVAAGKSI